MIYPAILELIPQRPPFVLVDEVVFADDSSIETQFCIQGDHYFSRNGFFHGSGLIENMAQSAAAHAGYLSRVNKQEIQLGFIGAIKKLTIGQLPRVGETIHTHIVISTQLMGATIVDAKVLSAQNQQIAACSLSIFLNS